MDGDSSQSSNPLVQQLPDDVLVQLVPKDNESFLRVQSVAKNPRMLCRVCLQKKISSLALFLEQYKWSSDRPRKALLASELPDHSIEDSFTELKSCVKLSLHPSQVESLQTLSSGITITHPSASQTADANVQSVVSMAHSASSLNMSFKSYLKNSERQKGTTKSGPKSVRKEKTTATTAPVTTSSRDLVCDSTPPPKPDKVSIETEDSCSSSSSLTPFRDTVKKLALLNQALGSSDIEADDCAVSDFKSIQDPVVDKKDVNESTESDVVSSSLRDDSEVSLPPPTATLAQWLSSREHRDSGEPVIDLSQDENVVEGEKTHQSPTTTVEDRVFLDLETIRDGWTSDETSISFAELYLLLKSPARIILTYSFVADTDVHDVPENKSSRDSEEMRYFRDIKCEESSSKKGISLLDKLLTAASISVSLHKKQHFSNSSACFLPAPSITSNHSTCTSTQQTPSTLRTTIVSSSTNRSPTNGSKKQVQQPVLLPVHSPITVTDSSTILSQHNFLMPTGPAPKAATHAVAGVMHPVTYTNTVTSDPSVSHSITSPRSNSCNSSSSSVSNNKRQRIICEDPQVLEDAIKQLNQNRFMPKKRQRVIRPITVGPVSSKLLVPRPTIQMMPSPAAPTAQIQILSAPSPVPGTVSETTSGPASGGLSLPICFTPNAVPTTILIPTVIATNMTAPVTGATPETVSPATLAPVVTGVDSVPMLPVQQEAVSLDLEHQVSDLEPEKSSDILCPPATRELALNQNSNQSLPCLSSLLELSLPDATTPTTSTTPSLSHSFFNDNSCSSISEFISFGNPNLGQTAMPAIPASGSSLQAPAKEGKTSGQTPNWLLNEGSNSSSLGLSSLMFNTSDLI